jgi:hypothetical protein
LRVKNQPAMPEDDPGQPAQSLGHQSIFG